MNAKQKILYKLRAVKIGWLNERMYQLLLRRESNLNRFIQSIKAVIFIINVIASAAGGEIDYRWWTITTSIIVAFDVYINKLRDEASYGSKIELHRSMTDECMRFTDLVDSKSDSAMIENMFLSLIERSSKLHIDPEVFDDWDEEFKKRGMKEVNAFEVTDNLSKELSVLIQKIVGVDEQKESAQYSPRANNPPLTSITRSNTINKKADFELQRVINDLNTGIID